MNKIGRAFEAVKTAIGINNPKSPTELAASIRKDIVDMREHVGYLDAQKRDQLCEEVRLRVVLAFDNNGLLALAPVDLRQRAEAQCNVKQQYRFIAHTVEQYIQKEQYRSKHVAHLWKQTDQSIGKATLGQLPEKLEKFAQALEDSDLIR